MARDDMHVIMYTILKYLYECLKSGIDPDPLKFSADALGINERYWTAIVADLANRGYIRGVLVFHKPAGDVVQVVNPGITIEGVEFMMENSMMQKALDFVKEAKSAIPFV